MTGDAQGRKSRTAVGDSAVSAEKAGEGEKEMGKAVRGAVGTGPLRRGIATMTECNRRAGMRKRNLQARNEEGEKRNTRHTGKNSPFGGGGRYPKPGHPEAETTESIVGRSRKDSE